MPERGLWLRVGTVLLALAGMAGTVVTAHRDSGDPEPPAAAAAEGDAVDRELAADDGAARSAAPSRALTPRSGYYYQAEDIRALQDDDFDRSLSLNSVPVRMGRLGALRLSNFLHAGSALFIIAAAWQLQSAYPEFQWLHWLAAAIFLGLLFYQHTLVRPDDLSKVNIAFFTTNGIASLLFGALVILDIYL